MANNDSHDNRGIGYLATDGANHNLLVNNRASNNGFVDILLDSAFLDPDDPSVILAPASFENKVILESQKEVSVLDFGIDNVVKTH